MKPERLLVCQGKERRVSKEFCHEASLALLAMTEKYPEELDAMLDKLHHVDRQCCVGIINTHYEGDTEAHTGLLLTTPINFTFRIVALDCAGPMGRNCAKISKHDNNKISTKH